MFISDRIIFHIGNISILVSLLIMNFPNLYPINMDFQTIIFATIILLCLLIACFIIIVVSVDFSTNKLISEAKLRTAEDQAFWCIFLLPLNFLIIPLPSDANWALILATTNINLLFSSAVYLKFYPTWTCQLFSQILSFFLFFLYLPVLDSLLLSTPSHLLLPYIIKQCFKTSSFTVGEGFIVSQGITLFTTLSAYFTISRLLSDADINIFLIVSVSEVCSQLMIIFFGCMVLLFVTITFDVLKENTVAFYGMATFLIGGVFIPIDVIIHRVDPISWLVTFLNTSQRLRIMIVWAIFTSGTLLFVWWRNRNQYTDASTSIRKIFHFILFGIIVIGKDDQEIIILATGGIVILLIGLECVRVLKLAPFGDAIQQGYSIFADDKDSGLLIVTPLYLLVGCAFPFWVNFNLETSIVPWSGVIAIAIGDSAASILGSRWGTHFWPESKKTIEGTFYEAASQFVVSLIFYSTNFKEPITPLVLLLFLVVFTVGSFFETFTKQIDNLVLPLFFHPLWVCCIRLIKAAALETN